MSESIVCNRTICLIDRQIRNADLKAQEFIDLIDLIDKKFIVKFLFWSGIAMAVLLTVVYILNR